MRVFLAKMCDATVKPRSSAPIINDNWFAIRFTRLECLDRNTYSDSPPSPPPPLSRHFLLQWRQIELNQGRKRLKNKIKKSWWFDTEMRTKRWKICTQRPEIRAFMVWLQTRQKDSQLERCSSVTSHVTPQGSSWLMVLPAVTHPQRKKAHQPHESE